VQVDYMVNILLLGDSRVGKSSLLYRLTEDKFSESYIATLGKNVAVYEDVVIHDTSGNERFSELNELYYCHADGAVIMYDVTIGHETVDTWKTRLLEVNRQEIPILIVGNKIDMTSDYDEIDEVKYVSCKTGENIKTALDSFIPLLKENPKISIAVHHRIVALISSCLQQ